MLVWKACTSFAQPQSNSTVPPRLGSSDVLDALLAEPVGELDDRGDGGAGALGDADGVGEVVDVAVGDEDRRRVDLVGGHRRDRVVRLQEGIDQDARGAVAELEA